MQKGNHNLIDDIEALAEPLVSSSGLELVLIEFASENGRRILRIYLDKPGGITLDDCAGFAKEFGYLLDVHLDIPGQYSLEVSSPGINRPLSKLKDFIRFHGEEVKIKTLAPLNGQRNFRGELLGVQEDRVCIRLEDKTIEIPYGIIQSARLCRN